MSVRFFVFVLIGRVFIVVCEKVSAATPDTHVARIGGFTLMCAHRIVFRSVFRLQIVIELFLLAIRVANQ